MINQLQFITLDIFLTRIKYPMFRVSRIFFIGLLILLTQAAPEDRVFKTFQAIQKVMVDFATSPIVQMIMIYDSIKITAPIAEMMDHIAEKKKGYFDIKIIDCNTEDQKVLKEFAYCQQQTRQHLPALIFNEPHLNLKNDGDIVQPRIKPYQGALDEKKLFSFAVPLMPTYSIELRNQRDLKKFESSYPDTPKLVYFSDKQKIAPFFKALTANFRNTIAFAHCFSKSPLTSDMSISSFPTFLLLRPNGEPEAIPIEKDLAKMIERLSAIEGENTEIYIHEYQNSKLPQITEQNFNRLVLEKEDLILIHVPSSNGDEHLEWPTITKKFKKMFKFYEVLSDKVRQNLGIKQTPAIVYYPKSLVKKNVQKTIFYASQKFDDIYNQIDGMIDDFTVPLADEIEMQQLISIHLKEEKLVAILFHEKQRSMAYKIISNDDNLQEHIAFFRMKDPKPAILEQFQVKKLPALIMLMQDKSKEQMQISQEDKAKGKAGFNLQIAQYTGNFNYYELFNYFSNFVKMPAPEQTHHEQEEMLNLDTELKEIKSAKKFKSICLTQGCYLLLVNNSPHNKEKVSENKQVVLKQAEKLPPSTNFAYLDGVCHSEILANLQIMEDQMPTLVYINSKFEKFSRMIGRLEPNSIRNFISKVRTNKAIYRGYDKLALEDKNCEKEHQKLEQLAQGNASLSEQEAAIIEELRQEQEQKRTEYKETVQKDRVRKKGKKRRPKREFDEQL